MNHTKQNAETAANDRTPGRSGKGGKKSQRDQKFHPASRAGAGGKKDAAGAVQPKNGT